MLLVSTACYIEVIMRFNSKLKIPLLVAAQRRMNYTVAVV
jgi:hypothetical protein